MGEVRLSALVDQEVKNKLDFLRSCDISTGKKSQREILSELISEKYDLVFQSLSKKENKNATIN